MGMVQGLIGGPTIFGFNRRAELLRSGVVSKVITGSPIKVAIAGTSIEVQTYGSVQAQGAGRIATYNAFNTFGSFTPSADQSLQATSGATAADQSGPTKHGIYETQLTQILAKSQPWDVAFMGAPVNDTMSSTSEIRGLLTQALNAGNALEAAGIYPVFSSMVARDTRNVSITKGYNLALARMCEVKGWGYAYVTWATINYTGLPVVGTYADDGVHPNGYGAYRYALSATNAILGLPQNHSVWLADSQAESYSVNANPWASIINDGVFAGAGSASLTNWATTSTGGAVTAGTPSTNDERDNLTGFYAILTRSAETGDFEVRQDTNNSAGAVLTAGEKVRIGHRLWGDLRGTGSQFYRQILEIATSFNAISDMEGAGLNNALADSMVVTDYEFRGSTDNRIRLRFFNDDEPSGTTGVINVAQVAAVSIDKLETALKVW